MSGRQASRILLLAGGTALTAYGGFNLLKDRKEQCIVRADAPKEIEQLKKISEKGLPTRVDQLKSLRETPEYDVLIIGGGATGAGVALDAVTRGFKTALVELDDFASGTSSRSTKLIHGGVRYLQKAIFNLDIEQYKMVREALRERANLLEIAPHLAYPLPIMLPVYKWYLVPYYWAGIKAYDMVAGSRNVKTSYYLSKKQALEKFPMLKSNKLCGAIVYYDGQQDDARMNLAIILTAARYGANVANHVAVTSLLKNSNGKLCGAKVKDMLSGKEWEIRAKCIINATGPFTDSIRKMDNQETRKICAPSSGVHITLPGYYSPSSMGLLDPSTSDGRVIFFLPWQNFTIAGTTDKPCEITHSPSPTEADIQFILGEIKNYLNPDVNVRRGDVMSAWCGIRPLVLDPSKPNTESIARNHIIDVSPTGLVTIAGGKWTTYRSMAEETVDAMINHSPVLVAKRKCQTQGLLLEGAHGWSPTMYIRLVQDYGMDPEIGKHLATSYGDRAFAVAKLAEITGKRWPVVGTRLQSEFPYIKAEIRFAVREYACSTVDVLARRMRIAFLNVEAAQEILPKIVEVMAEELKWSKAEQKVQFDKALKFLETEMGLNVNKEIRHSKQVDLSADDVARYTKQFHSMDTDKKGYIGINDLRRSVKATGQKLSEEDLHAILSEVDLNKNGEVELNEYLELMSALKTGTISQNRLAAAVEFEYNKALEENKQKITVERSGGGL